MQRNDLVLLASALLVAGGLYAAVGVAAALIAAGLYLLGYWIVINLDDEGDE